MSNKFLFFKIKRIERFIYHHPISYIVFMKHYRINPIPEKVKCEKSEKI